MGNKDDIEMKRIVITSLEDLLKNGEASTSTKRRKVEKNGERTGKRKQETIIKNPELRFYDPEERGFYQKLTDDQKRYVAELEKVIRGMNKEDVPLRFKILMSNIDEKIKAIAIKKLRYLYDMDESTTEYYKMTNWIESLCKLPIGKYRPLPITKTSSIDDIRKFIKTTKEKLDATVFGHEEAKDQIIRLLAQWISNPHSKGMVIGIHGSPGTGKTLLSKYGISKALDLPFSFLALGGASDASWLDGHSYTYEGSTWGKIVDILMKAECMNPVLYDI
jgi:ATP-dependent Lon protease